MNNCFFGHKWTVWKDVFVGQESLGRNEKPELGYPIVVQERRCERCKRLQRNIVRV
jgi:hypothetical protein